MIGVFGGTFDPVHYGHLRPALEVLQNLALDEVRFIPCRIPPHRGVPSATPEQRLKMLRIAIADQRDFRVDTRELERDGPSYMVDTLGSLRQEFLQRPLCLIVGMDAFLGLSSWHRWRRLPELAHVVVMHRPGLESAIPQAIQQLLRERQVADGQQLARVPAGRILFCPVTQLDISATLIRAYIREGRSARYLLPDPVLRTIEVASIYR